VLEISNEDDYSISYDDTSKPEKKDEMFEGGSMSSTQTEM
jgi:hypothetical protein